MIQNWNEKHEIIHFLIKINKITNVNELISYFKKRNEQYY